MDSAPLIVDEGVPLDQLSHALTDTDSRYIFDGFIVTRDGRYLGIGTGYSLMRWVTEREHATLFHLAHHDSLTGLPNRQLFHDRLVHGLAHAARGGEQLGVLYIDVDQLKTVNDSLGHAIGDLLLGSVADRLRSITRAADTVARLSGDEFAVILTELKAPEDGGFRGAQTARRHAQSARSRAAHAQRLVQHRHRGVPPRRGRRRRARTRRGRGRVSREAVQKHVAALLGGDLPAEPGSLPAYAAVRRALDEGHLAGAQPQILSESGALCGVEALVRWTDPERGSLPTTDLIQLAEDSGLIGGITDFVLGVAMARMLGWEREGLARGLSLAVNVSGVELRDGTVIRLIERHLAETGFPASALEVEITESTAMASSPAHAEVLRGLAALGIRLAIDDFGTGYSSLSRLRQLPVSALKVDRTFVDDIEHRDAGTLAGAIILMAHSLGLTVTGEGIETAGQRAFLEPRGCDRLQGYFIGRPLSEAEMTAYLRQSGR